MKLSAKNLQCFYSFHTQWSDVTWHKLTNWTREHVKMLFIDHSSAWIPLCPPSLSSSWDLDPELQTPGCAGRLHQIFYPDTQHWRRAQRCVFTPFLYSLFTHNCVATQSSNPIIKFADDATVIGLITMDDECSSESWYFAKTTSIISTKQRSWWWSLEKSRNRTCPHHHQWDYGGESQQVHVPPGSCQWGKPFFLRRLRRLNIVSGIHCNFPDYPE